VLQYLVGWCAQRRIAVMVITLGLGLYGVWAYTQTPVEAYPDVTNLQVTVITQLPGFAAEEVERRVTIPIERAVTGIPDLLIMRTQSLYGLSLVVLTFRDGADPFVCRKRIAQRVSTAELPEGVVPELSPDATPLGEVYQFRLNSDRHDLYQLRTELEWRIGPRIRQEIPGVAEVVAWGGYLEAFDIEVDPDALLSAGVTLMDVFEAIEESNMNAGGGFAVQGNQEFTIRSIGLARDAEDLKQVVVKAPHGLPIIVDDVARVVRSYVPRRGTIGMGDEPEVVAGFILLRRGENPGVVLAEIHRVVNMLNGGELPAGMRIEVFRDRSTLVERTLSTVHHNLLHGFLLVVGLVWLFLRSIRGSAVVAVIIPLSLLTAFIGLHALGLPANLISVGAIDFGILVDGAVVVVESVLHLQAKNPPKTKRDAFKLVVKGARAVVKPMFFAMSIIMVSLFPIFTLEQVEGRIFRPLALTYTFALLGALIFALTIVPALLAATIKAGSKAPRSPRWFDFLQRHYKRLVTVIVKRPLIVLPLAGVLAVGGVWSAQQLGTEFLPELDEGDFNVFVELPSGIDIVSARDLMVELRARIAEIPEVTGTLTKHGRPEDGTDNEGVNIAQTFVRLKPPEEWRPGMTKQGLLDELRGRLEDLPGLIFNFTQPIKDAVEEAMSGVRGKVVLKIFGEDLEYMRDKLIEAEAAIAEVEGVVDLSLYRDTTTPQLQIQLDRSVLAREGLTVSETQGFIETALSGQDATTVWDGEIPVPVRVRLAGPLPPPPERLDDILMPTPMGRVLPLSELGDIGFVAGRESINRERGQRYMALKFNIHERDMGSVVAESIAIVRERVSLDDGFRFEWGGEFENQERAMARLQVVVPLSLLMTIILLYMALGSARAAITILLCVPFGIVGGFLGLWATSLPLSISAAVGFITLLGQVALMGLLIIGACLDAMKENPGLQLRDALPQAATDRMRPVVIASVLAMFGLLPMAMSTGPGSETSRPFAMVIVCGMLTTLLVALTLVPAFARWILPKTIAPPELEEETA